MSSALPRAGLGRALIRHGATMDPEEFIEILAEAAESTETITDAERQFLVEHAHVDPGMLKPEPLAAARQRVVFESARADAAAALHGYTTGEVAQLLGTHPSNIRRSRSHGDLYASGMRHNRETVFPAWQFRDGRTVPHLRQIIPALPDDMHPLDVEAFMTAPQEALDGRTVVEWLSSRGAPGPVLELAEDMNLA